MRRAPRRAAPSPLPLGGSGRARRAAAAESTFRGPGLPLPRLGSSRHGSRPPAGARAVNRASPGSERGAPSHASVASSCELRAGRAAALVRVWDGSRGCCGRGRPLLRTPTPSPPVSPPHFPVAKLSQGGGEAGAAQRLGSAPRGSGRFGTRRKAGRRGGWGLFKCKTQFVGRKSEKVRSPWRCWSVFALQQPEPAWKNPPGERNCLQPPRRAANN